LNVNNLTVTSFLVSISGLVSILLVPALIIFLVGVAPTGLLWDFANLLGYIAVGSFLLLFVYSGRPRAAPPFSVIFFGRFHRDLGLMALFLTTLHIGLLMFKEPLLIEHMKLSAPWYMLGGLIAALLIVLLILSSVTTFRNRIWSSYGQFQHFHKWVSLLIVFLTGLHLAGSRYYLNEVWKIVLLIILASAIFGNYFFRDKTKLSTSDQRIKSTHITSSVVSVLTLFITILFCLLAVLLKYR